MLELKHIKTSGNIDYHILEFDDKYNSIIINDDIGMTIDKDVIRLSCNNCEIIPGDGWLDIYITKKKEDKTWSDNYQE